MLTHSMIFNHENLVRILKVVETDLTIARDSPSCTRLRILTGLLPSKLDLPSDEIILISGDEVLSTLIEER
jgi:hypothetical protein